LKVLSVDGAEARPGRAETFTGRVLRNVTSSLSPPAAVYRVLFEPAARSHWHSHPDGQVLYVLEGWGRVQASAEQVLAIGPGDVVYVAPDEKHWHGADPDNFMIHLAISPGGAADGRTEWMEEVTDEEYSGGRV